MRAPIEDLRSLLLKWYQKQKRDLPWRSNKDPYRIWLSEVMLQQTTVAAVIPYFEKFVDQFPNVKSLAQAELSEVLSLWSGLGYYSRARNLHRAAQEILKQKTFPQSAQELRQLPGFGPYTSAAVASIAFSEKIGVLDGNVIRVLTRVFGLDFEWWKSQNTKILQDYSNQFAQKVPDQTNQALMELGATVCTPRSPVCTLCPWLSFCVTHNQELQQKIPLPKPRKKIENWLWQVSLYEKNKTYLLVKNNQGPVLKNQWIFPSVFKKVSKKPPQYSVRHGITHHDLYIQIKRHKSKPPTTEEHIWVNPKDFSKKNPSKVLQKIIDASAKK